MHCRALVTFSVDSLLGDYMPVLEYIRSSSVKEVRLAIHPLSAGAVDLDFEAIRRVFSAESGVLSTARLVIVGHDSDVAALIERRRVLFERLCDMRAEGRLEFERAGGESMDPDKQTSLDDLMDEFF